METTSDVYYTSVASSNANPNAEISSLAIVDIIIVIVYIVLTFCIGIWVRGKNLICLILKILMN